MNKKTKIFLDSGDPSETKKALKLLGSLDGQTTNPSLIAKNPEIQKKIKAGGSFSESELFDFYKQTIIEISKLIPKGSISIEVYADQFSSKEDLLSQARNMQTWITNSWIKFPTTKSGIEAAQELVKEGGKVNMTLVFSQAQALAIDLATRMMHTYGDVFVSPFIGRLDDIGLNGLDLIKNILKQYQISESKVQVLAASIRNLDHLKACFSLGSDIITAPYNVWQEWVEEGKSKPENLDFTSGKLSPIDFHDIDLNINWQEVDISHELTLKGLEKFATDWNSLMGK